LADRVSSISIVDSGHEPFAVSLGAQRGHVNPDQVPMPPQDRRPGFATPCSRAANLSDSARMTFFPTGWTGLDPLNTPQSVNLIVHRGVFRGRDEAPRDVDPGNRMFGWRECPGLGKQTVSRTK
jgi:hypothetical protein